MNPTDLAVSPDVLTERERDVARLLVTLPSYKEIGRRLRISDRTAEVHVHNIRRKLGPGRGQTYKRVALWAQDAFAQ